MFSLEFQERGLVMWAFLRTWYGDSFRRAVIGVVDRFEKDATRELSVVGSLFAAVGSSASAFAISGRSHALAETYAEYLGSGYTERFVEYPIFSLRLLKRCLHKVASSVFGCLDPLSMKEVIIKRLKGAKHRDWLMSRSSLRYAIITNELRMPSHVEIFANIVGVWPLIVLYLKETVIKTDGYSWVVYHIRYLNFRFLHSCYDCFALFQQKSIDRYFYIEQTERTKFRLFHLILEVCMYGIGIASFGSRWYVCALDNSWEILGILEFGFLLVPFRALSSGETMTIASPCLWVRETGNSRISAVLVTTRSGIGVEVIKFLVAFSVCSIPWRVPGELGYFGSAHCSYLAMSLRGNREKLCTSPRFTSLILGETRKLFVWLPVFSRWLWAKLGNFPHHSWFTPCFVGEGIGVCSACSMSGCFSCSHFH